MGEKLPYGLFRKIVFLVGLLFGVGVQGMPAQPSGRILSASVFPDSLSIQSAREKRTISDDQPVVINEIYALPNEDANGDGRIDPESDRFIEILNRGNEEVDISNWKLSAKSGTLHIFDSGTILSPRSALILFDEPGKSARAFGGALVVQSTSSLNLGSNNEEIVLTSDSGIPIDSYDYGSPPEDGSLVRNPDGSGDFVNHNLVSSEPFSPGFQTDGSNFDQSLTVEGKAGWRMLSVPYESMPYSILSEHISAQETGGSGALPLFNNYDGTTFAFTAADVSTAHTPGTGLIAYFAQDYASGAAPPLKLQYNSGSVNTADINDIPLTPNEADKDGWTLLGNPYETTIDIANIENWVSGGSLISTVAQIWDPDSKSFVLSTTRNHRIGAWQGFLVQNNDANTIDIPASAKTAGTGMYREKSESGYLAMTLRGSHSLNGDETTDRAAVLYFHENAVHDWDRYDAAKLSPLTTPYALLAIKGVRNGETVLKAQDSRSIDFEGEIQYEIEIASRDITGDFELSWKRKDLPDNWNFTLVDNEAGSKVDMNLQSTYQFSFTAPNESPESDNLQQPEVPGKMALKATGDQSARFTISTSRADGAATRQAGQPESVKLNPNYPNPFSSRTVIPFELADETEVTLTVWNMIGQKVATLVDEVRDAGEYRDVRWNASSMPSGMYIARLEVGGEVFTRKMTLIK